MCTRLFSCVLKTAEGFSDTMIKTGFSETGEGIIMFFATAAMGTVLLIPLCVLIVFCFMVKVNRIILSLVPLALLIVYVIFNYNELEQLMNVIVQHSLIWMVPLVIVIFVFLRNLHAADRMIISLIAFGIGFFVQTSFFMPQYQQAVNPFDFRDQIASATIYRHTGGASEMAENDLADFKTLLSGIEVHEDLMKKSRTMNIDDETSWYVADAVLNDGSAVRIAVFPQQDDPDLLRIERADGAAYYEAMDEEQDIGSSFINSTIEESKRAHYLSLYRDVMKRIRDSFVMNGTSVSVQVPSDLPEGMVIHLEAFPEGSGETDLFEHCEMMPGSTCSADVAAFASYRALHVSAEIADCTYDLVNVFDLLPEDMKSSTPSGRYQDSGIA